MTDATLIAAYSAPFLSIVSAYLLLRRRRDATSRSVLKENLEAGLGEPASLHPLIDPTRCLGCGACISACPEGSIIGLIAGKANLIDPGSCIGHGACATACPHSAIELVFGSAKRGVELPRVGPDFQTNVPGLYIAGELGGMGLVRNAIEQGRQAVSAIAVRRRQMTAGQLDLVIVGAGPAGLSAALGAKERGLSYVVLEQDRLGGAIAHFPRGKLVMTRPAELPIVGKFQYREVAKEELVHFWRDIVERVRLVVRCGERVERVERLSDGFHITTTRHGYRAAAVLLAIGRRGTPRRLDVPGEHLPKVVYSLEDAASFQHRHVLVIGGGDSALEAAASIAEESDAVVTLSYRGAAFQRAKPKNRQRVQSLAQSGRLAVRLQTHVTAVENDRVVLKGDRGPFALPNTDVIVCAGGIMPTAFLESLGVEIETKYGTA